MRFFFSLQDQNKLTNNRAYAALPHLDYRHAIIIEGCRFFQKRQKNRIPTLRVTNDSTITQS